MIKVDQSDWHWWDDSANLADLIEWLDRTECLDMTNAIDILRTPWSWTPEWEEMQREKAAPPPAEREEDSSLVPLLQASIAVARGARERTRE